MLSLPRSGEHEIDGEVHEPSGRLVHQVQQRPQPANVDAPSHRRVEFARFQGTATGAIQHSGKLIAIEQLCQLLRVLQITRDDRLPPQTPVLVRSDAHHLPRIPLPKVVQRIVTRYPSDSGDQQG